MISYRIIVSFIQRNTCGLNELSPIINQNKNERVCQKQQ